MTRDPDGSLGSCGLCGRRLCSRSRSIDYGHRPCDKGRPGAVTDRTGWTEDLGRPMTARGGCGGHLLQPQGPRSSSCHGIRPGLGGGSHLERGCHGNTMGLFVRDSGPSPACRPVGRHVLCSGAHLAGTTWAGRKRLCSRGLGKRAWRAGSRRPGGPGLGTQGTQSCTSAPGPIPECREREGNRSRPRSLDPGQTLPQGP